MVTATETLTINLSVAAAQRLRRVAEISGRALDDVIADTLHFTLPPLLEDVPAAFHAELSNLETLTTEQLRQQMYEAFDVEVLARYDVLLAANVDEALDELERQELMILRTAADALMFRKAYAALLLRWRGERIPTLAELEAEP